MESEQSLQAERGVQERPLNDRAYSPISKEQVKGVLKKMKSGKTVGP